MRSQKMVVIGASAGGVDALMQLVANLPHDFPAAICVVLHIPADSPSLLAQILMRNAHIRVKTVEDGERYEHGTMYVAAPDHHLLTEADGTLRSIRGPRENRHRPAIDPLFRSAALAFGPNATGVILTGTLDDGTAGLLAIKQRGGITIVQDPEEAMYPAMPRSAMEHVDVDHVVTLRELPHRLLEALSEEREAPAHHHGLERMKMEKQIASMDPATLQEDDRPGHPSPFSCPDCGGVLWEVEDGEFVRYRCRVGHALSPETMLGAQAEMLEEALWSAMKTLEESARLAGRLAATERQRGHQWMVERFEEREKDARDRAEVIRRFLLSQPSEVPVEAASPEQNGRTQ